MIHIITGNTGSGKTTYSRNLSKKINGVVFSIDKWNNTLFLPDKKPTDGLDWFLERIDRVEKMAMEMILQLERCKVDAILDLGFSKYEQREKFRKFAASKGIEVSLHFLDIPKDTRYARVLQRNNDKGESYEFEVTVEDLDFMETWFEVPDENEMRNGITIRE